MFYTCTRMNAVHVLRVRASCSTQNTHVPRVCVTCGICVRHARRDEAAHASRACAWRAARARARARTCTSWNTRASVILCLSNECRHSRIDANCFSLENTFSTIDLCDACSAFSFASAADSSDPLLFLFGPTYTGSCLHMCMPSAPILSKNSTRPLMPSALFTSTSFIAPAGCADETWQRSPVVLDTHTPIRCADFLFLKEKYRLKSV